MRLDDAETRLATLADHGPLVDLCTSAFADDPLTAWTHPDPVERIAHLRTGFAFALSAAIDAGAVMVIGPAAGSPVGAALWQPWTPLADVPIPGDSALADRMRAIQMATQTRRPTSPHVYLPSMAVHPVHRGKGLGAALLAAVIDLVAAEKMPIYLEASSDDNRRFYARHAFHDLGGPLPIAHDAPTLQPMLLGVAARRM